MRNVLAAFCLVALLFDPRPSAAAERPWVEVKSAHFVVVSDSGEKTAREIVWQFEQIRAAIRVFWPWVRRDLDKPVLVLAARDQASMKALAPQYWEARGGVRPDSVFVTGADRHYIALRTDVNPDDKEGINPYSSAYWSYSALALEMSDLTRELPLWLYRGLASFLSNTIIRDSSIQFGRAIPWHLQRLRSGGRLPLRDLLAVDRSSPWYSTEDRLPIFDAQSWGLVHYLMLGDEGAHRAQLNRLVSLLVEGKTPAAGYEVAFGNLDTFENALVPYFFRQVWQYQRIDGDLNIKREAFAVRTLSPADAAATRAAFHAALGRPAEARALIADARKTEPTAPASFEVEAFLFETEGKTEEARTAYAKAIELGSTHYFAYYRWAALARRPETDAEGSARVERALQRAITLNDGFAPAYALLAEVKAQLGRPDDALGLAKRAVSLEPRQARHRLTVAIVLWRLSRREEAEQEARGALGLATTDPDRQAAQQLLDFFAKGAAPPAVRKDQ
jgi:tetratricopeptide (TPR) repeat protein